MDPVCIEYQIYNDMGAHSKRKGKSGELEFANELKMAGWASARRGCQFAGRDAEGQEFPDVVCSELPWLHFEVKRMKRQPNLDDAMAQSERDRETGQVPIVAHRKDHCPWLITMDFEDFVKFLRGDLPPDSKENTKHQTKGK